MNRKSKIRPATVSVIALFLISILFTGCAGLQRIFPLAAENQPQSRKTAAPIVETKTDIQTIEVIEEVPAPDALEPSKWTSCFATGQPLPRCIKKTQELLFQLGYRTGPRDGIYGARTRKAIAQFQEKMALEADGLISASLLDLLESMAPESLVQAETGQPGADLSAGIRNTQELLKKLGYKPGPVDGILGGRTRNAIRHFQKDINLPENGRPSQYLLTTLQDRVDRLSRPAESVAAAREKPQAASVDLRPKLYLLAVGASNYRNTDLSLSYPSKDARDFAKVMAAQKGMLYRDVAIKLLTDPTRDTILSGLEWLERETTSRDMVMAFLAGHGVADRNSNYYFLPVDGDPDRLKRTAVTFSEIENTLTGLPGKVVAFVDTCHAGGIMGRRLRGASMNIDNIAQNLSDAENGVVFFASSTGRQNALEDDRWQNGAFTKALVEGLSGKADINTDRAISITELDYYLSERVKQLTGGKQTPATAKPATVQDFPVAVTHDFHPARIRPAVGTASVNNLNATTTRRSDTISEELQVILRMLKSDNPYKKKTAAMDIYRLYPHNPQALAAVRDTLLSRFATENPSYQEADLLAWMCKILGASGKPEFIPALKAVAAGAKSYKVRSFARKGVKQLGI
ncbi:MAG: hypothetical protein DSY55_02560 [Clostridia bacterium]|nr:MAG: hypothetical protein DSY55_02560 [Clostridia bacterium]